jgi:uncharacterized phiE125 gp8 family phage protein
MLKIRTTTDPAAEPLHLDEVKNHLRVNIATDDDLINGLIRGAREWVESFVGRALVSQIKRLTLDKFPSDDIITIPFVPLVSVSTLKYIATDGTLTTRDAGDYKVDIESEPARITPAFSEIWPATRAEINAVQVNYLCGYASPATASVANNTLTTTNRTFADDDIVRLTNSGGALPTGWSTKTNYYVINASGNTFELSLTSGGAAVAITADSGGGTHFVNDAGKEIPRDILSAMLLIIGHLYEHREAVSEVNYKQVPMAAKALLRMNRVKFY